MLNEYAFTSGRSVEERARMGTTPIMAMTMVVRRELWVSGSGGF